jgi:hypothetical protein
MNRQMNQMSGGSRPGFTAKQGQYLAFINAYTPGCTGGHPPNGKCNGTSTSPRLRCTKWFSRSNAKASSDVNPACRAV